MQVSWAFSPFSSYGLQKKEKKKKKGKNIGISLAPFHVMVCRSQVLMKMGHMVSYPKKESPCELLDGFDWKAMDEPGILGHHRSPCWYWDPFEFNCRDEIWVILFSKLLYNLMIWKWKTVTKSTHVKKKGLIFIVMSSQLYDNGIIVY